MPFSGHKMKMVLNFNSYLVLPRHKGISDNNWIIIFHLTEEACFKIKNHEQIYLQNNSFLYQTATDPVIEIMYLRLQMKSVRYHSWSDRLST